MYGTLVWDSLDMVFVRGFHWVQMIASDWKWDEPASIVSHMTITDGNASTANWNFSRLMPISFSVQSGRP